jgi:hypothetical protein
MKKPTEKPKLYVVRKYIRATSAAQAIRKDKTTPVHDAWVDTEWKTDHLASAIGFELNAPSEDEEYEEYAK